MIPQSRYYTEEHEVFRASFRQFLTTQVIPFRKKWQAAGQLPRELWLAAGEAGFLCTKLSTEYGGGGGDIYHCLIILEEQTRACFNEIAFYLHSDIIAPYIELYGTQDQKRRLLPQMASGELVAAIAMTEPGAGSDLRAIKTTAEKVNDHYVLNGQKTFISNGQVADLICVAAKTSRENSSDISLFLVETQSVSGFKRGRNLKKLGCKAQDSSELFFDDVQIPKESLLGGEEGKGLHQLMKRLPEERLIMAISAVANMESALETTVEYANDHKRPGVRLMDLSSTRIRLAEAATTCTIARTFLNHCLDLFIEGNFDTTLGAIVKLWTTERQFQVVGECLQLHGELGCLMDSEIARRYADSRLGRIAGGTNEIMKELISRTL